jgi:hypothetical protein
MLPKFRGVISAKRTAYTFPGQYNLATFILLYARVSTVPVLLP